MNACLYAAGTIQRACANQSESGRMAMEDMYVYRLVHAFADLGLPHLAPGMRAWLQHVYGRPGKD